MHNKPSIRKNRTSLAKRRPNFKEVQHRLQKQIVCACCCDLNMLDWGLIVYTEGPVDPKEDLEGLPWLQESK
jgi:hypothetical protein